MSDFTCEWCGESTGLRVGLVVKVEMFDPNSGQDLQRTRREFGFCTVEHRAAWIYHP